MGKNVALLQVHHSFAHCNVYLVTQHKHAIGVLWQIPPDGEFKGLLGALMSSKAPSQKQFLMSIYVPSLNVLSLVTC